MTRNTTFQVARVLLAAVPGSLIVTALFYLLQLPEVLHEDTVVGIGLTAGALLGMVSAFKTRRNRTADVTTCVLGSLSFLLCVAWGLKELINHQSAVGWNRLPHVFGLFGAAIYGFGALCLLGVGVCGLKIRKSMA